jgi:hypothetical protein
MEICMEVKSYGFAEGSVFQRGADTSNPNSVGTHIEFLRRQHDGELKPEFVVNDARNPNSPLHSFFEWDDTEAAEQYRLNQARRLIRTVVAIYTEIPNREPVRAFMHIRPSAPANTETKGEREPSYYTSTVEALTKPDLRFGVLRRAKAELDAWRQRYADLKELSAVMERAALISDDMGKIIEPAEEPKQRVRVKAHKK